MHELDQCDAEFFETNKVLNKINTEIPGACVDTSLSATEAGPCCFHSDSDADISQVKRSTCRGGAYCGGLPHSLLCIRTQTTIMTVTTHTQKCLVYSFVLLL